MNFGRFCESGFWMAKVAMNRMSEGNTFYGRKLHITSYVDSVLDGKTQAGRPVAAPPLGVGQDRRMWNFPALALQEDSAHLKALSAQRDQIDEHLKRTQKVLESWKGQIGPQTCTQSCRSNASASSRPQANHPKSSTAQVIEAERVVNKLQYKVRRTSAFAAADSPCLC